MPQFVIALLIVVGGLWIIRRSAKLSPQAARAFAQKLAGGGIIAFSGLLALRGQMNIAVPVFLFGAGLIGKSSLFPNGFGWGQKSSGQKSRVATALLAMELDHDSGGMDGEVLAGPSKGKRLSGLSDSELRAFHGLCGTSRDQSRALLEAWLDRNKAEWRASWGQEAGSTGSASSGPMSKDEARAILGVRADATADDIRAAHRRLMKDFHPDKGGSDYLAAKINAAKDVLLGS